jgi:hypothetical protein
MNEEVNDLHEQISAALSETLPKTLGLPDWVYRDLPRMTPELFDEFVRIVGEENIKWLTIADYGDSKRGQVLISPQGMNRLSEYNKSNKQ